MTVSLTVAVGFALAGYWPILPFAGLELLALGAALRWSLREGQRRELIRVDEDRVLVRKVGRKGECVRVRVRPAVDPGGTRRVPRGHLASPAGAAVEGTGG